MTIRTIGLAAALALGLARPAAAQNVITQPDWAVKPDAESFARHYPPLALGLDLSGTATISCSVSADGRLVDCRVLAERPVGVGFGQAAVAIGGEFRMRPLTLNGKPVDGGTVRIPIRFVTPQGEPPTELPPPVSDEAARQALRAVDAGKMADRAIETYEQVARKLEGMGEDRATARAAADAYRHAAAQHRDDIRTTLARAFASVFSEAEMAGIADFAAADAPDPRAGSAYDEVETLVRKDYQRNFTAVAHGAFCAQIACGTPADLVKVWRAGDPRDASRIDAPQWARQPSEREAGQARPGVAVMLGLAGTVRMTCRLTDTGGLRDCGVDEEAPGGLGFGASALSLSPSYQLSAIQLADAAAGRKVTVRVGFPAPDPGQPFKVKPGGAQAMALARRLTDTDQLAHNSQVQTELQVVAFENRPTPKGADAKLYAIAIEAYRAAAKQALTDYIDQSLNNVATAYSEKQLAARVTYQASPSGKASRERSKEMAIAAANAQAIFSRKIIADAKAAFCQGRDCPDLPTPPRLQASAVSAAPSTPKP